MLHSGSLVAFAEKGGLEQNSTKVCEMLGNESDLHTHVKNLRGPLPVKIGELL